MRQPTEPTNAAFSKFIKSSLPSSRGPVVAPASPEAWNARLSRVKEGLSRSLGHMPKEACDLAPEILGVINRDGYAIERLTFQSRPGVRVTANLYRPEPKLAGSCPAVLSVHGHWAWARMDVHVQPRCIALARLGYVVLCVDAFGAGERAIEPASGTYHGALTGGSLWPAGVPLIGLQVYDNRRAIDYLISRPEVDATKLAITGASGGGNQSLYAGALDERITAVVPVCGVGTYEAYTETACCVCEVLPGGLAYATTGDLLAMVAPRPLLVINASKDAIQFSPGEAKKSLDYARERFTQLGVPEKVAHVVVDSGHDYNQAMREAMYGWLERWLHGKGDGSPVPEPAIVLEEVETLRCYPEGTPRPDSVATIPVFALAEGRARLAALPPAPDHAPRWEAESDQLKASLAEILDGHGRPALKAGPVRVIKDAGGERLEIEPERGITLTGRLIRAAGANPAGTTLLLRPDGMAAADDPAIRALLNSGQDVLTVDLRAIGLGKPPTSAVRGVVDHNETEWSLWVDKPLLGLWIRDAIAWLDALDQIAGLRRPYTIIGMGGAALMALGAAALDDRPASVRLEGVLASYVAEGPGEWSGVPMGLLVPRILDVADVGRIAALVAPRPLRIVGAVEPTGRPASAGRLSEVFAYTRDIYGLYEAAGKLEITTS
ncbi:acetylxylan esterase [Isosphaeraceae bacterium EP7]